MQARLSRLQQQQAHLLNLCNHCGGGGGVAGEPMDLEDTHIVCQSLECGVHFERAKTRHELRNMRSLASAAMQLLEAGLGK
jgi:hypothetical protein